MHVLRMFVSVCGWKMHVCVGVGCEAAELSRRLSPLSGVCVGAGSQTQDVSSPQAIPGSPATPAPMSTAFPVSEGRAALVSLCDNILCAQARSLFLFLKLGVSNLNKPLTTSITFLLVNHSACCLK